MRRDFEAATLKCKACDRYRNPKPHARAQGGELPHCSRFEKIYIDIIGRQLALNGIGRKKNCYILSIVDSFTGWAEEILILDQYAKTVCNALIRE